MGRRWSLRTRFVLVAASCLLPLLGAVLYVLYHSADHGRDRLLDAQETTAGVVAQVLGATLEDNRSVLQALAAQPEVQRLDDERAESVLGQFRLARPNNPPGFFLVKSDRQIVTTAGLPTPLPEGIGPVLDQALGPNGLGVSNRLETEGGDDVVAIAVPVLSKDQAEGQPVGVVGAVLSVDQLGAAVLPFARGETAIAIVGGGEVIANRANDDVEDREALSERLGPPIAAAAGALSPVTYTDAGDEYLAAYAPVDVPGAEWAAFVTRPAPAAFAPTRMLLNQGLAALALAVVVAIALATAAGEWFARPVRGLTEQAVALTRGDFAPRPATVRGGELGTLGAAFRVMANRFATQVRDLEAAREENAARAERLRELNRRTVRLQEDERRRIAAEIHDAVAPLITGALYQARALRLADGGPRDRLAPAHVADGLDAVSDLLARAMAELHDVIFDLRPPDLDDLGVVAAIERYAGQIQRSGLTCRLEVEGEPPELTPEVRLAVYRIVQEALHNALRHASADEAVVRLETTDGLLRVTVRDNGAGFDPARAARPSSLGLLSMRERADAIGARFAITSRPGDGTTVVIERRLEADAPPAPAALPVAVVTADDAAPARPAAAVPPPAVTSVRPLPAALTAQSELGR